MTTVVVDNNEAILVKVSDGSEPGGYFSETEITDQGGIISVDWRESFHYFQKSPVSNIGYAFIDPDLPCELTLRIDAFSSPVTFTFTAKLFWIGEVWTPEVGKMALLNIYYDGTNYYARGGNLV